MTKFTRQKRLEEMPDKIWLCEECDAILPKQHLSPGDKVFCPNCKKKITEQSRYPLQVPLAFAITGLLLLIPACTLPLIKMQFLSSTTNHSIVSGILDFIQQGMWVPAILILFGTIISPFIYLVLSTFILSCMTLNIYHRYLITLLRLFDRIKRWGMLEVYLLGIFIAIIKLSDIAKVYLGFGLIILAGLIFCQAAISLTAKSQILWDRLDLLRYRSTEQGHHAS